MKYLVTVLWQTGLLMVSAFAGFVAGMIVPAVRVQHVVSQTATHIRTYDFNWVIAVAIVYVILLLVGAVRKHLREMFVTATIASLITIAGLVLLTQIGIRDASIS